MRDLFMTTRSFVKRLTAFLRYRRATQDMNKRYVDATVEDIEREDTCIICREQMRPWSVTNPEAAPAAPGAPRLPRSTTVNERSRPKKLPCGHILHLGCLKSWLERQQVCPTCRRPVVENAQVARNGANAANQAAQAPGGGAQPPPPPAGGRRRMRVLNLGPFRVGFGQPNLQDLAAIGREQPAEDGAPRVYGLELGMGRRAQQQPPQDLQHPQPERHQDQQHPQSQVPRSDDITSRGSFQDQLQQIEQRIMSEIRGLQVMEQELQLVRMLQTELARLRLLQIRALDPSADVQAQVGASGTGAAVPSTHLQRHGARAGTLPVPAGSSDLPPGVTIPEGWSLLPLQRLDGAVAGQPGIPSIPTSRPAPTPTAQYNSSSNPPTSNIARNPVLNANPGSTFQGSSSNSDANVRPTHSSSAADQPSSVTQLPLESTLPSNTPGASTSTTPNAPDPSALPSWGSSQLFSNGSQSTNTTSGHEGMAAGADPSSPNFPIAAGRSSALARQGSNEESEARRREVGRAVPATVEDTTDDAD
jgi:E3 ubiquitin-protein ligase synoviolin